MVGDDPDEEDSNVSIDSESTPADYTNAKLGLPNSSSLDDTDNDAAGDDNEGMVLVGSRVGSCLCLHL